MSDYTLEDGEEYNLAIFYKTVIEQALGESLKASGDEIRDSKYRIIIFIGELDYSIRYWLQHLIKITG